MQQATNTDWLPLMAVCRRLGITYSRMWGKLCTGAITAEQRGSRWWVRASDLPWIANEFGVDLGDDDDQDAGDVAAGGRCDAPRR